MNTTTASVSAAELTEQVLQTLERAPQPLTFFQIQRNLPRPFQGHTDELRQRLREQVAQGRLHEFPPYRSKAPRFWTRDPEQHARVVIVETLNEQAVTQRELLLKIQRRLQGLPEDRLRQLLGQMLLDGQLRKLPPRMGGRANLLSAREPQPGEYLAPVFATLLGTLREVHKRLESEGVSRERFLQEADALWQAMPWDRLSEEPRPRRRAARPPAEMPESSPTEPPAALAEASQPPPEVQPQLDSLPADAMPPSP